MPLADYQLLVPFAEWTNHDWKTAIHEASGIQKRFLQMQEMAAHGVAGFVPTPLSPEKLAWITLWSRGYVLLQTAVDLHGLPGARATSTLYRVAFELWLQIASIREPWEALNRLRQEGSARSQVSDSALDAAWSEVADRLRAFAAWALTSDLIYYRYRTSRRELIELYSATDPQSLPKTPHDAAIYQYLFGEPEILTQAETARDRNQAQAAHEAQIHRLEDWLKDPCFGSWISQLAPWIAGNRWTDLPSFFKLLDPSADSTIGALRAIRAESLYALYSRGSMLMHGSSITQFVAIGDKDRAILPLTIATDDESNRYCTELAKMCHGVMLGLWGMRDHCLLSS